MKLRNWLMGLLGILTLGLFLFIAGYFVIYMNGSKLLFENLEKLDMAEATVVYDRNGEEYTKLYMQNRELVKLEDVPDHLKEAVIATEDQRFYEHAGVDFWSIGRAIVKDILERNLSEGGSTITQQLAKNMFLSADKTFFRKATEVSIALALENNFDKDQILEMYLNRIYLGNGAYGVQAAAERHFGKDLKQLNLLEVAIMAGLPKAPETYSPTNNPEKSLERAKVVLSLMADQGYITEEERRTALNDTYGKPTSADRAATAVKDYILKQASEATGISENELRIGGYKIYTTVDAKAQRAMDQAFANPELFPEDGPEAIAQGAMAIIDPKTGGIAAMNGGRNYVEKGTNRAIEKRQPGSSFKPIAVYGPALETGKWTPYSMLTDEKRSYGNYSPSNLNGKYAGQMTMIEAVRRSINAPAVWLLNEIGVDRGLEFAKQLGIQMDAKDRNLAIALGGLTKGASPLEMARAYGAFANGGMLADTFIISEVKNSAGNTIYKHEPKLTRVMSEQTAYSMTVMLQEVTKKGGTGARANFGRPVAGKTGTTQLGLKGVKDSAGNRDIWFVGYTPEYAAAVWMGFDNTNKEHFVKTGSGTAATMFATVMEQTLKGRKVQDFERPEGVSEPKKPEPLAAVTDVSASYDAEAKKAVITWSPAADAEGIEYRLYRKEAGEASAQVLLQTGTTVVEDISILPAKTYQYYVTVFSVTDNLESAPSNTVEVVVPEEGEGYGIGDELPALPDVLPGQEPGDGEGTGNEDTDGSGTQPGGEEPDEPDSPGQTDGAQQPDQPDEPEPSGEPQQPKEPVPSEPAAPNGNAGQPGVVILPDGL